VTLVTINFSNVTLSSTTISIQLVGGVFGLDFAEGLSISSYDTFSIWALRVTAGAISFSVAPGTAFNAAVQAKVTSNTAGTPPSIEVTNFTGTVTASWLTSTGLQTQLLESGNQTTLSGYFG